MLTIDALKSYGADTDDGLKRCMGNGEFYIKLVMSVIPDKRIDSLANEIESGDLDAAFETAHGLKGVYANLALTPIQKPVSKITELLRSRTKTDYTALINEARTAKQRLDALAGKAEA